MEEDSRQVGAYSRKMVRVMAPGVGSGRDSPLPCCTSLLPDAELGLKPSEPQSVNVSINGEALEVCLCPGSS